MWWPYPAAAPGRQHERPHGILPEVSKGDAWAGKGAVAGRTGSAHLREYLRRGLEALGRADEDDPQRVSADALAEGSAAARDQAHGGFLLRRRRRAPARIRPPAE